MQRSDALGTLTVLAWPWVMPLFMLLSGEGAWYSLQRKGIQVFLRQRSARLLLPLFFGILVIIPPQVYVERLLQGRFQGSYIDFLPHLFNGFYPQGNLAGGQLWFVGYLYFYILLTIPLLAHLRGPRMTRWLNVLETRLNTGAAILIFPALPFVVSQVALRGVFPESLDFVTDWAYHTELLLAYVYGIVIAARPAIRAHIDRHWPAALALGLAAVGGLAWLILVSDGLLPIPYRWEYFFGWSLFGLLNWVCLLGLLGAARYLVRTRNRLLEYASEIALPFYLVHQTAVAILAYFLVQRARPIALDYLLLVLGSIALTTAVVEAARLTRPSRYLLGLHQRAPAGVVISP
jgi:hypothetical protein